MRIHTEGDDDLSRFLQPNDGNDSDPERGITTLDAIGTAAMIGSVVFGGSSVATMIVFHI